MLVYTYMNVYLVDCIGGSTFYASDQSQGILSHSLTPGSTTAFALAKGMLSNMTQPEVRKILVHCDSTSCSLPESWEHAGASLLGKYEEYQEQSWVITGLNILQQLAPSEPPMLRERGLRESCFDQLS